MENERLVAIRDAAAMLFLQQGYSKTQISHIAKAVGVSVGTIYLDFAGKQEIVHFILKCAVDPSFSEREFERPIRDSLFSGLDAELIEEFERTNLLFSAHLGSLADSYGFDELISDAFDILSRFAVACLFIEKNQLDFPELAAHYKAYRRGFLDSMRRYIEAFIAKGEVRPLEHVELTTTLIVEILSWWAMDMRYVSFEKLNVPVELAKATCMDNIVSAYRS